MTQAHARPRVLSGITATGKLTIGNYIGAISSWVRDQDVFDNFFFIADLHALTIPEAVHANTLRERIKEVAALYLACGLDPNASVLFRQSQVPSHASLAWILDCITPVGWLERMTQFKSKAKGSTPTAGLFTYPVLMAADILLYQAAYVPVGADQQQHIELARNIAQRFNNTFGSTFRVPEALIRERGARIMGLDNPEIKMSKSLAETRDWHAVTLLDPPEKIRNTVMRAKTDSGSVVCPDDLSPGVENLLIIYEVLSGGSRDESIRQFGGHGYGVLKTAVSDAIIQTVTGLQKRYAAIRAHDDYVDGVLSAGAERASEIAEATLTRAMELTGLR